MLHRRKPFLYAEPRVGLPACMEAGTFPRILCQACLHRCWTTALQTSCTMHSAGVYFGHSIALSIPPSKVLRLLSLQDFIAR